jgi:hypothetical protein
MGAFITTPRHGIQLALFVLGSVLAFALAMAAMHALPTRYRRWITVLFTFVAGLFYLAEFVIPAGVGVPAGSSRATDNFLSKYLDPVGNASAIIFAVAVGMGILNLARVNGAPLLRGRPGWQNSLAFFAGLIAMTVVGLTRWHAMLGATTPAARRAVEAALVGRLYHLLFDGFYSNLGGTVFALLAFYIVSASYRAFRLRSREATLMMVTAFIVMLGNVPVGPTYLTGWIPEGHWFSFAKVEHVSDWIMSVPNMAAQRALIFGIMMGVIAMSLRVWLSLERGHFFGQED